MKIGLEYEGVIHWQKTGDIVRWSDIPMGVRKTIKRIASFGYSHENIQDPCDNYDCLAEVRTIPMTTLTARDILFTLFTELRRTHEAFKYCGYVINWAEEKIPDDLHKKIQHDLDHPTGDRPKIKKYTQTIVNGTVRPFVNVGNKYRGGGLHINVSSIPCILIPGFVMRLHESLRQYLDTDFKSHYRTNLLFRHRLDGTDSIAEYMSFGFNLKNKKSTKEPVWHQSFDLVRHHFHWVELMLGEINEFVKAAKEIK